MTDLYFKPKDSDEDWRKLNGVKSLMLQPATGLPIHGFVMRPDSITLEAKVEVNPITRLIIKRIEQYHKEAEEITKPLQEKCKKCTRVLLLVDKEKKEIIRPMCQENCPYYILTQQSLNELYERYNKIINPQTERKQND